MKVKITTQYDLLLYCVQDGNTALHVAALHNEAGHVADLMMCNIDHHIKNNVRQADFILKIFLKIIFQLIKSNCHYDLLPPVGPHTAYVLYF